MTCVLFSFLELLLCLNPSILDWLPFAKTAIRFDLHFSMEFSHFFVGHLLDICGGKLQQKRSLYNSHRFHCVRNWLFVPVRVSESSQHELPFASERGNRSFLSFTEKRAFHPYSNRYVVIALSKWQQTGTKTYHKNIACSHKHVDRAHNRLA